MASVSPSRDLLRYTTELPRLENILQHPRTLMTNSNVAQMSQTVAQLLEVALDTANMPRIEKLLEFQAVLDTLQRSTAAPSQNIRLITPNTPIHHVPPAARQLLTSSVAPEPVTPTLQQTMITASSSFDPNEILTCPICYEDFTVDKLRAFLSCNHRYCSGCMESHLTSLINDASVSSLKCPDPSCYAQPEEYEVANLVPQEVYEKYLTFTVLAVVEKDPNLCYCPNRACGNGIIWNKSEQKVICPACRTEFCFSVCSKAQMLLVFLLHSISS